jgi:hypothetical protein
MTHSWGDLACLRRCSLSASSPWIDEQIDKRGGLPSSLLRALADIRERRVGLSIYPDYPEVSIGTTISSALCGLFLRVRSIESVDGAFNSYYIFTQRL